MQDKYSNTKPQGKNKVNVIVRKEDKKYGYCSHYDKDDHNDDKYWKLYPQLQPKWFSEIYERKNAIVTQKAKSKKIML